MKFRSVSVIGVIEGRAQMQDVRSVLYRVDWTVGGNGDMADLTPVSCLWLISVWRAASGLAVAAKN